MSAGEAAESAAKAFGTNADYVRSGPRWLRCAEGFGGEVAGVAGGAVKVRNLFRTFSSASR